MATFQPLDLSQYLNADRGNPERAAGAGARWQQALWTMLPALLGGEQTIWGVPFRLGPREGAPCWIVLGDGAQIVDVALPAGTLASHVLVLHFCNSSYDESIARPRSSMSNAVMRPGEHLADYALVYADGDVHSQPIRRRFEINEPTVTWGQNAFAARPDLEDRPCDPLGAHTAGMWGKAQTGIAQHDQRPPYWLYALVNPHPERPLAAVRLSVTGADTVAIAGITLFRGKDHPLRHQRMETLRVMLPGAASADATEIPASIDLGVIVRRYAVPDFKPAEWLVAELKGWGEEPQPDAPDAPLLIDVAAAPDATLRVGEHAVEMGEVLDRGRISTAQGASFELMTPHKAWLHVTVIDDATGKPTPARVHFRSADGRYFPPYGHRHQVNDHWFEDYGADLKLGSTQYAYVDGKFQIELPVGACYAEVSKGYEYDGLRQELTIAPGQRELAIHLKRRFDVRRQGWVTADTHVHFISPQTAWLEGQAEGLNLINLLASQWGDLYTNVGDLTGQMSGCSTKDMIVWVGTENREHILGHMSLLGVKGEPIAPMCVGGPDESYFGDPMWTSLSEWADRCRAQDGVVVMPHFPNPYGEVAANILLGKVDGVELREFYGPTLNNYNVQEWYRFLNLGCRVAAVGGTDKMSAGMPVGGVRTYANIGDNEFSYDAWARAVRAGRTFTSSGPIIDFGVDGRAIGDEIALPAGGGTLEVRAAARSVAPFHILQIVQNGQVVAEEKTDAGACEAHVSARVEVDGSSWLAARCLSMHKLWHCWPVRMAAHTSPIYVTVDKREQFSPADATYMLTMLEGGLTWLDTLSIPASPERQAAIRRYFHEAQHALEHKMHAHAH